MTEFPEFMQRAGYPVDASQQNTKDVEGYWFDGAQGQMAVWTCREARESQPHTHAFDEYMAVLSGEYVLCTNEGETVLHPGDEAVIPGGTRQWGRCAAGTRTVHAFGGKRIHPKEETDEDV
jgi:quercetin dioxygenase-like cupin family protein